MGLLLFKSLAERVQARATLVREVANAHVEAAAAQATLLQARGEAAEEIRRVKDAMARQAEKEVSSLKKKLEAAYGKRKAKDATNDL
jgi:uncharacterized protein involved in exopolysaccharide biosynthesis